ncbi:Codeine 3-O-demethylase [Bertholletia excelsa]
MGASEPAASSASSLSLQELVKEPIPYIPHHYLHPSGEPPLDSQNCPLPSIPVIDLQQLLVGEATDFELEKLHDSCKEWGIFQLVNHGVSSSLVDKLKSDIVEFYKLPLEEKMRYKLRPGEVEGYGQTIIVEEGQKVDWADRFYMLTNPVHRRKPHLLPELPLSLRESIESYLSELQKLAMTLLRLMGKALNIERKEMDEIFEDGMQSVRMTYYPPCPWPEKVMGITPHSDATGITFLLQVNGVEGFQIKRDGIWVPVNFLPDAFIVNVGDVLEILSNGLYQSIEHRATVNSEKERISLSMFINPKLEAEVGPSHALLNPQNPPLFKRLGMQKYVKEFFSHKLNGKSFLEHMKIKGNAEQNTA